MEGTPYTWCRQASEPGSPPKSNDFSGVNTLEKHPPLTLPGAVNCLPTGNACPYLPSSLPYRAHKAQSLPSPSRTPCCSLTGPRTHLNLLVKVRPAVPAILCTPARCCAHRERGFSRSRCCCWHSTQPQTARDSTKPQTHAAGAYAVVRLLCRAASHKYCSAPDTRQPLWARRMVCVEARRPRCQHQAASCAKLSHKQPHGHPCQLHNRPAAEACAVPCRPPSLCL